MNTPGKIPYEESERRAQAICDADVRRLIGPHKGHKFVKSDVITGDYEIGGNSAADGRKLSSWRPGAIIHTIHNHRSRII